MKFYLGVTDNKWFKYLWHRNPEDVNFWQPGGNITFKVIEPGAPFLFKLPTFDCGLIANLFSLKKQIKNFLHCGCNSSPKKQLQAKLTDRVT